MTDQASKGRHTMDGQWQGQSERWLRLIGLDEAGAPGERLQLEAWQSRAVLTLSRPLADGFEEAALMRLLGFLPPEASGGLPLRAWTGRGRLWLSVAMPAGSAAEAWYAMSRQMRAQFERAAKGGHGLAQ